MHSHRSGYPCRKAKHENLLHSEPSNPSHLISVFSHQSQQRQSRSPERQRSPDGLHPRGIRRGRPLGILRNDTRLRDPHTRQIVLIARRYSAVPGRGGGFGQDGLQVVGGIDVYLFKDGGGDGGLQGGEDGGVFRLLGQGGEVGFEVVEDVGGLRSSGISKGKMRGTGEGREVPGRR